MAYNFPMTEKDKGLQYHIINTVWSYSITWLEFKRNTILPYGCFSIDISTAVLQASFTTFCPIHVCAERHIYEPNGDSPRYLHLHSVFRRILCPQHHQLHIIFLNASHLYISLIFAARKIYEICNKVYHAIVGIDGIFKHIEINYIQQLLTCLCQIYPILNVQYGYEMW